MKIDWINVTNVLSSLLAGVMLTTALINLVPEGMWLYLIYLVMGTAIITNKLSNT